ncbi:tape measure protein [Kineococcus sp. SYSU DK002]|uniref:tape measure protein n=1 Tax=Kineococcus sp. SYSU DK002 TaxID=3383123 RepID=UPI003D7EFAD1
MAEVNIRMALQGREKVRDDLQGTGKDLQVLSSRASRMGDVLGGALSRVGGMASGVMKSVTTASVAIGAAGLAMGVKTAAGVEQSQIAFTTMLGSAQKAQSFLGDLSKFAAKTPFDLPGLTQSASFLVSAGIDASKVIPIMTSLGNATSGMGTGAEGIQRATVALQQMNAAGRITGEDLNQLRDAGVPVFDLLSAATGKSVEQVAALAQAGKLGRTELTQLMDALVTGKGLERFNGLMDKQSQSLTGLWSSFQDTVNMGLAGAVQPLIPLLKDGVTWATRMATSAMPPLTAALATAAGGIRQFIDGFQQTGPATNGVRQLGDQARDAFNAVWGFLSGIDWAGTWATISTAVSGVRSALSGIDFSALGGGLKAFGSEMTNGGAGATVLAGGAQILGGALQFLADHMDTIVKYMPAIAAGFAAWKLMQQAQILITLGGMPVRIAELGVMAAHARANAALAAQMRIANGVAQVGYLTRVKDFALKVKDLAVITALAVRYAAWQVVIATVTAVQWLFNAAATAGGVAVRFLLGPVGLVITAIGLLVGGLILAYKKSDTFRGIVDGLWAKLKEGGAWVRDNLVPILKTGLVLAVEGLRTGFNKVKDAIGGFVDKIKSAWDWVKKLADRISDSALGQAISGISGAVGSVFGGGRASGGPVTAGTTYLVGERGPELFTAGASGYVSDHRTTLATLATLQTATVQPAPVSLEKGDYSFREEEMEALRGPSRPLEIPVILDGREIARAVYRDMNNRMARA